MNLNALDFLSQDQINQLKDGINQTFTSLNTSIGNQVFAEQFPLIGNNLKDAFDSGITSIQYLKALRDAIETGLNTLTGNASYTVTQVQSGINTALQNAGISGLGVTVTPSGNDFKLNFNTKESFVPVTIALENDLGLPNLGLKTSGSAKSALDYTFNFGVGLDSTGFYFDTSPTSSQLQIKTATTIPNFNANASLSLLNFTATDSTGTHSAFNANIDVAFKDPNNDNKLRTAELAGSPDLLNATISKGNANINLNLLSALPSNVPLPKFGTNLNVLWNLDGVSINPLDNNATFGSIPTISFNNNTINIGSFFSTVTGQFLNKINMVTSPIKPILDILTTPIPLLSDLGDSKVTLLDIFGVSQSQASAIKGLSDIANLASTVANFTNYNNEYIDLGSLSVNGDLRSDLLINSAVSTTRSLSTNQNIDLKSFLSNVKP
ncbi:hypothetical protein [uncultured Nostoc sp.]|uniref:hypothetical protein n=1 Tax=uncultured Nostoc sp. TaxID=340711 RepID=UPI0035CC16F1